MSDDVLSIIPADPHWQPDQTAADRTVAIVADLAPGLLDGAPVDIEVTWHDELTVVDCGGNLERIGCPHCGSSIDTEWWADLLDARSQEGFTTLSVQAPCCGTETTLDKLDYDWPCGFARFEIEIWNPERTWFSDDEMAVIARALGHPVRQIRTHI